MAGGSWREVNIDDGDVGLGDGGFDGEQLKVRVVDGDVDGRKGDGVMNENCHPTTSAPGAILDDDVVSRDGWSARRVVQFRFLNGGDGDVSSRHLPDSSRITCPKASNYHDIPHSN